MPNPPLLGASRDEITRIVREQVRVDYKGRLDPTSPGDIADQILALPAFAGLLTPSLSHEEEVENGQWTEPRHGPSEDARPESPSGMGPSDLDAGRSAEGAGGDETGWLIEGEMPDGSPGWMTLNPAEALWGVVLTKDSNAAIRFARRRDAEEYVACHIDEGPFSITEHRWQAAPQTTPPTPGDQSREEPK